MIVFIKKLRNLILQFSECNPKKRGRSLSSPNPQDEKQGDTCTQKRKSDGKQLYYRTNKGKNKIKRNKSRASKERARRGRVTRKQRDQYRQNKKARLFKKAINKGLFDRLKDKIIKVF